ncbi:uncharacterized protein [Phaenicophaeus curvirostris]|uniref:uncharacterized protein isoform X2 n=1 Tax=Phaenicophaeus curvirostris TaxID=33595 RepID=UPI0037F0D916
MMREPLRDPNPSPGRGGKRRGGALQASSVQSTMEPSHLSSTLMAEEEEGAHGETEAIAIQVRGETSSQHSPENQSGECPCCRKPGKSLAEQPCFFKARYSSVPSQGVTVIFSCLLLPPQRLSSSLSGAEPVPQEVARKNLADVLAMREPLRDPDPSPGRGGEATWRCPPGQQRSGLSPLCGVGSGFLSSCPCPAGRCGLVQTLCPGRAAATFAA